MNKKRLFLLLWCVSFFVRVNAMEQLHAAIAIGTVVTLLEIRDMVAEIRDYEKNVTRIDDKKLNKKDVVELCRGQERKEEELGTRVKAKL